MRGAELSVVILLAALSVLGARAHRAGPDVVLWAWERTEDLRFLDPASAGVAALVATVQLVGDGIEMRPRRSALIVPQAATVTPVVRIEASRTLPPSLSARQRELLVDALAALAAQGSVQIDFDATTSQRDFYREVLVELRPRLNRGARLSITALASWCLGDHWLDDLPIDEAVPMLFRMGADAESIRQLVAAGVSFRSPFCQRGVGVAIDEPLPVVPQGRPVYVFAPHSWSPADYDAALRMARDEWEW